MIPRAVCLFFLSGIFLGIFLRCDAAPKKYDRRQIGEWSTRLRGENFLLFFVASKQSNSSQLKGIPEEPTEALIYETENADEGRVPYHVEIVRLDKDTETDAGKKNLEKLFNNMKNENNIEPESFESDQTSLEKNFNDDSTPEVSISSKSVRKGRRSLWRSQEDDLVNRLRKDNRKSGELKNLELENFDEPDDFPAREDASKATRPGISLKKQLSKKEEKVVSSMSEERNELTHVFHELVLLGDGIENCGPGRYRDRSGVCQNDENFN